ncbi:unnamed protein product [Vitrella brassicaformis CCMP3155]|uniref:D-3-phosphoglycerate dehydrogenase n=2 Tax=Vitrella brassicaformis TaxID=1169539 RepID=A0A0G4FFJ6_VITBC|nr:unnamed protein product [Vitrella brassicaformis CCMP3155]|eukprot:CEM11643.1 unnamed protein product [Vitrella brassicaformis CCMP3155]
MASRFRVLVSDPIDSAGVDILSTVAEVDIKTKLTEDQLCEIIGQYDALMVRSGTQVTDRILARAARLKIVGRAGVGVDNVHVKAATDKGIFVVNSPLGNIVAAAEHTLAMMFALARNVPAADASVRAGKWERNKFMGSQLQHKILGIVGLGQVGSHVAKVGREMGMKLVTYDPYVNTQKAEALDCSVVSMEELFRLSDFITLHVPLIPETKAMINAETLKHMKPTARIINCSRGGVIDEKALSEALQQGRLAGAALDVFEDEKAFPADHPLLNCPNVVLTPHLGASTHEAQVNVAVDVAQQIKETLLGNLPQSAVNIPGLRAAELQQLLPLLTCCDTLGRLAVQLLYGPMERITVVLEGDYAAERGEPPLLAVAKGALGFHTDRPVNFVNVRQVAELFKVALTVAKEEHHAKAGVRVELKSKEDQTSLRGTITDEGNVLLTSFKGVSMYMLLPVIGLRKQFFVYTQHDDTPGALSLICGMLGEHGLNIGDMHLGRTESCGVCISSIDSPPSDTFADALKRRQPPIREYRIFSL